MSTSDPPPSPKRLHVRLRLYHDFERPRNGREVPLNSIDPTQIPASHILTALTPTVDTSRFLPHYYCTKSECFLPITPLTSSLSALPPDNSNNPWRIDIKLISTTTSPTPLADTLICNSNDTSLTASWFGIGIVRGKTASNHGTLWRSALQLGASLTFTIGRRYEKKVEGSADIYKTYRQVPCLGFPDVATFMTSLPVDAQLVAVEYGGVPLTQFQHPKRALYVLGSEDSGLPPALVQRAHAHVQIPTADGRPTSLNVAAAGAIIMYDRLMKREKEGAKKWKLRGPSKKESAKDESANEPSNVTTAQNVDDSSAT